MSQRVTPIDQLPELEDIGYQGGGYNGYPDPQAGGAPLDMQIMDRPGNGEDKYQKYIRGSHRIAPRAGMEHNEHANHRNTGISAEGYGPPQPYSQHATLAPVEEPYQKSEYREQRPDYMNFNCPDVAMHIQDCPICSKFYNSDKSVYIVVIVILAIVCLLLLKKVLNV